MSPYTGPTVRGVNYGPTWPDWVQGSPNTQTYDSDFVNDAFQSLWSDRYVAAPSGDNSRPHDNGKLYRNDLEVISSSRFNLVRPYDWNMSRGASLQTGPALGHINFLKRAWALGLKVVVPVSDYFLNDHEYSWNGQSPNDSYSFNSAPAAIQTDFNLFISSITDPATGKIHAGVHSISVGNEGDLGEGGLNPTTASNFLARTIWWIRNLHLQINGPTSDNGPNGRPVVNGPSPVIPLSATISNADQGGTKSYWFLCFLGGVTKGQATPAGCKLGPTFTAAVPGLKGVSPGYATYYYNSVNVDQSSAIPPYGNSLAATLKRYDNWPGEGWPGAKFDVPLMLMEVFTANRSEFPLPKDQHQAEAAVNQVIAMEKYLKGNSAGGPRSTTQFMGYNYFEFNDEPAKGKHTGLLTYSIPGPTASTGTTAVWFSPGQVFPGMTFPFRSLTPATGPSGANGPSLIAAIARQFP
jgi:hypothetical protein